MVLFHPIPSHFLLELEYPTSVPGERECWYQSQELCHLNKRNRQLKNYLKIALIFKYSSKFKTYKHDIHLKNFMYTAKFLTCLNENFQNCI